MGMEVTVGHARRWAALAAVVFLGGCGGDTASPEAPEPSVSPTPEAVTSPSPAGASPLPDGYVTPGRYRFVVSVDCAGVEDPIACPDGVPDPPPIPLEVTVPSGWEHMPDFPVLVPSGTGTDEGALVLGWTSNTVGVQTDPCLSRSHQLPDVAVGPGVDDFVDTVTAQSWFRGTEPVAAEIGGASGRHFTLEAPADLGGCVEWRPWDPGFYAQGPSNTWQVWVLDVRGHRVVVVADHFPTTPARTISQLSEMVESIRFPST